ncbi:IS110 family transposase [Streptosporangium sp. NPDC023963]|uniref:IS110 family transposase n=1 Tax=Streptosporangium sp. NPDC023963 TaxID=3155608 RepID=UPI003419FBFC
MGPEYAVFLGLDVGKGEHHACALDPSGKKLHDKPLPNDEQRLRALFGHLSRHGRVLVVVDQPASIGALPVAVARAEGCQVAYLPGLTMRRLADVHPGNAKTDARDAFVIADAARTLPHTLRRVDTGAETLTELEVLLGFDDDLSAEATRVANRIRGLLTTIHPALEKALGPKLHHPAALEFLIQYGGPEGLRTATAEELPAIAKPLAPRMAGRLVQAVKASLDAQTVTVPGTTAAATVLPHLAWSLRLVHDQRKQVAAQVEEILAALPLAGVLTSMPGLGIRTAARILVEIGDIAAFATSGHLAAYAGLPPVTRRSGSSIKGEHPPKGGNKSLKRAMFLSAFAALSDPLSRAYCDRKRAEGKKHNAALICLARRRSDVIYAMLRDRKPYQPTRKTTAQPARTAA